MNFAGMSVYNQWLPRWGPVPQNSDVCYTYASTDSVSGCPILCIHTRFRQICSCEYHLCAHTFVYIYIHMYIYIYSTVGMCLYGGGWRGETRPVSLIYGNLACM